MPNYLKPDTEQTFEEGTPSSNEGQGCQTPDRNTYQLASHAEWNLPKTGFTISSSWPITIDRRADSRAHSWASSLPRSQSTWATTFVMRACAVCLPGTNSCSWEVRLIVCYSLPQGKQKLLSQAGRNQVKSKSPHHEVHTEQAWGCLGDASRSALLLQDWHTALTPQW